MLMDPAVNLMFLKMKSELKDVKEKLAQAQSDLSAWKFSTDRSVLTKLVEEPLTSDHQCSVVLILYHMLYCITSSHDHLTCSYELSGGSHDHLAGIATIFKKSKVGVVLGLLDHKAYNPIE